MLIVHSSPKLMLKLGPQLARFCLEERDVWSVESLETLRPHGDCKFHIIAHNPWTQWFQKFSPVGGKLALTHERRISISLSHSDSSIYPPIVCFYAGQE